MKKLFNFINSQLKKLWFLIKTRTTYVIGIVFIYVVPIYMLNEKIALTKTLNAGIKLSYMGIIALVVLFFIFKNKVKESVSKLSNKVVVSIIRGVYRVSLFIILHLVIGAVVSLLELIKDWSLLAMISVFIGSVLMVIDKIIQKKVKDEK